MNHYNTYANSIGILLYNYSMYWKFFYFTVVRLNDLLEVQNLCSSTTTLRAAIYSTGAIKLQVV